MLRTGAKWKSRISVSKTRTIPQSHHQILYRLSSCSSLICKDAQCRRAHGLQVGQNLHGRLTMGAEWIEFKPSLRDELISRAQVGEINPEQAEAEAAANGLPPFATTPPFPAFDPQRDSRWSIAMGLAWIAWADMGLVRDQNAEFRSQRMRWVPRRWNWPNSDGTGFTAVEGWFLETRPAPTPTMLSLREEYMKERNTLPSSTRMSVRDAEAALWGALSEGRMVAEALNSEGKPVDIPEREWSYLLWVEGGHTGCLISNNASDQKDAYSDVKLKRDDLLRLWPAVKDKPLFHERQAFIEVSMFAPMEDQASSAGYVPLCVALHWIMAKGGTWSVRLDDVAAWTAAVAQVHPLICEGTLELIGQPRGETFTRPFQSSAFSLVRIRAPVDDFSRPAFECSRARCLLLLRGRGKLAQWLQ